MTDAIRRILSSAPPRATSFIVTLYGDVVEPRGGALWMGTLIECCARHGISESLVRTAVSRLVAAGRLKGARIGRKSYYRLSAAAQAEFRHAGRILFAPPDLPSEWVIALGQASAPRGWASLGAGANIAPYRPGLALPEGATLLARTFAGGDDLPRFAAIHWPLDEVAGNYRGFLARFGDLKGQVAAIAPDEADALDLRLRLTDEYRQAALADPRLPADATADDWPAAAAHDLFRRLYLGLSPAADRCVGRSFADSRGLLSESTDETRQRYRQLARR